MISSVRRPRSLSGTRHARNSCGYSPPTPMPRMNRPPVARSMSAVPLGHYCRGIQRQQQDGRADLDPFGNRGKTGE